MKFSRILKVLKATTDPKYFCYILARKYVQWYEGFSYRFEDNGEQLLIEILSKESINVVFDVGANVGEWTEIALHNFPGATIHSFELSDLTYQTLLRNLKNKDCAVLNGCGLSNKIEEIFYKDYGENSGLNTILLDASFHDLSIIPVERKGKLITGDHYCREHQINSIDLIKIDVEGAEHLVLEGFHHMLETNAVKVIQFEYGYTHADAKFLIKDFYKLFNRYGYVVGPLKPTGVLFGDFDYRLNDFCSGPNYVAVLKNEKSLIEKLSGKPIKGFPN